MSDPITRPAYRYGALVTAIYDADTIICDIDVFDHMWKKDEIIRLYGINAQEIKRSKAKGIDAADVQDGYDQRDELIGGKFGRLLGIVHKDGVNLNEHMRDTIGGVEFYDGKVYTADTPIRPPQ